MKTIKLQSLINLIAGAFFVASCGNPVSLPPAVTTSSLSVITENSAVSGGDVTSDGGLHITARGVCWDVAANPTTSNSKTTDGQTIGVFTSSLTGLASSTTYYVRAYATNTAGTSYGNELTFTTGYVCGDNVTDIDGNVYTTINIGGQCWMQQNLKTSKYNDGVVIPTGLSNTDWSAATTGAYAYFNDDATANVAYGKLYNWYAVNSGKLAPAGWHISSDSDWIKLNNYLGGAAIAGDKIKSTNGWTPYAGITNTNSSGFTAIPGGFKLKSGAYNTAAYGFFWTSTNVNAGLAWACQLFYDRSDSEQSVYQMPVGMPVRCIKD